MATNEIGKPDTSISSKHSQSPQDNVPQSASAPAKQVGTSLSSKLVDAKQFILSVAANISSQPLPTYDPNVWGVLTVSLTKPVNALRLVKDKSFKFESRWVSTKHCGKYRKRVSNEGAEQSLNCDLSVCLKDISVNGTYLNWERLRKNSPAMKVQHELAFAFVYRDALKSAHSVEGECAKRKADELACENERQKGLGIGAPEGPISLDDFRSLQRSNKISCFGFLGLLICSNRQTLSSVRQ